MLKYYKLLVFIILITSTVLANYFNIEGCIRGTSPSEIEFLSSIIFIGVWAGLSILSSYKKQIWFIVFATFYWLFCLVIHIIGLSTDLLLSLALSTSPLGVIPLYGILYLPVSNSTLFICSIMFMLIIFNIILYFVTMNKRTKTKF